MTIKSMTGFARADGTTGAMTWHWEVRSVNGRGLDIRMRVPPGFEGMETRIREAVNKRIGRGSLTVTLNVKRSHGETQIQLNEVALKQVLDALEKLGSRVPVSRPNAEAILGIKGVLEVVEPEETEAEVLSRAETVLTSLGVALDGCVQARAEEGLRLQTIVLDQMTTVEHLVAGIERSPARSPDAIKQRLKEQVARLMDTGNSLEESRLYQEAVLLATRADIEEELKRLRAHIASARQLLQSREPAGRRLDFLAQEFNREANTLCSKSNDAETTRAGLELKAVIDQMREQVQNIE